MELKIALPVAFAALLGGSARPADAQSLPDFAPGPATPTASGFSASLAIAGEEVLIGRSGSETRMAMYPEAGTVHVFSPDGPGWAQTAAIAAADGEVGDQFGAAMAVSHGALLVGAPGTRGLRGVAYIFVRDEEGWREAARLDPDADPNAGAGAAVALGADEAFVGAPGGRDDLPGFNQPAEPQPGIVFVFREPDGGTGPAQRLTSPDEDGSDRFGAAVLVAADRLFVGAPGQAGGRGVVFRFAKSDGRWTLDGRLEVEGGRPGDRFGASLAEYGTRVLVGAPGRGRRGEVYVFESADGAWRSRGSLEAPDVPAGARFGTALAADDESLWVGAPGAGAGAGAVWVFDGAEPAYAAMLAATEMGPGGGLGSSVAIAGDLAAVGAALADLRLGAAATFERAATGWRFRSAIRDPGRETIAAITGEEVRCEAGAARDFACDDVDLVAFVPLAELGAGPASIANDIWGWTDPVTGREYVLLGKSNGTSFVDITDPSAPVYVGELPLHAGAQENLWRDIKTYRDHAFIVADGAGAHGLQVFDLTRLRDVREPPVLFDETAHYDGVFSSHNIVINEETGFAFSVGGGGGAEPCGGGLHMIDIRDPRSPEFAGCFVDPALGGVLGAGYTHDAQCVVYRGPDDRYRGREICFQASLNALGISDVTDKSAPSLVATADYPGVVAAHQGWLTEDHRYFFLGDELDEEGGTVDHTRTLVWDVAELDDPVLATEYFAPTRAIDHNMYVRGRLLYQSNLMSGLRILDIGDPENPVEVGFFDTVPYDDDATAFGGTWSNYPFFPSGVIAVSSWNEGLFLLRKRETRLVP